jgi:dTDP-4-amino-4,6-dideoxygalactose transaminase
MIKFVDLKKQYDSIKDEIDEVISSVISNSAYVGGSYVEKFASEFADYIGTKNCIPCANGTDAIEIALKAMGIGIGDEVLVPSHTWISTAEAVTNAGAKPVFVDTSSDFYNINPSEIQKRITRNTKAIIPVHLFGNPADMGAILKIAEENNLKILEDAAQAHGAMIGNRKVGTIGNAAIFSFYPSKNLGAYGDGGCIVTDDDEIAHKAKLLANHGQLKKHEHLLEGRNSRLDGIQAAILSVKLKYLDNWNEERSRHAQLYNKLLRDVPQVSIPAVMQGFTHVFHVYCIKAKDRDKLKSYLDNKGIETEIHYPKMLPFLEAYKYLEHTPEEFPVSFAYQPMLLSLPMYPELTDEEIKFICDSIIEFYS